MDSKQFLKEMLEAGEKVGDKPISKTIGKVKFELGFSGFCSGHHMLSLFRAYQEPGKAEEVKAAVDAHIRSLGGQGGAYTGIKYSVPAENIISFEADYGKEGFVQQVNEEADFNEILGAISELDIPIGEWVWIAYKSIDSPTAVAKGEDGKFRTDDGEMKYRKIIVPLEKFTNEEAARAAAGNGSSSSSAAVDDSQWSDTARGNYKDIADLKKQAKEVSEWYTKMIGGTAFNNDPDDYPLPKPITPPAVKGQLAELYAVESADVDILLSMDVAF